MLIQSHYQPYSKLYHINVKFFLRKSYLATMYFIGSVTLFFVNDSLRERRITMECLHIFLPLSNF